MKRLTLLPTAAALGSALLLAAACGGGENTAATEPAPTDDTTTAPATTGGDTTTGPAQAAAQGVDPREGGFEIALGEWALTPEAESIRPGRATFVITNRGTQPHGFEIEREDGDDSSGSGSDDDRDKVETRVLQPGESVSVDLNLAEGVYKLECNVDGHDDMGMEMLFEVKKGAPLAKTQAAPAAPQAGNAVAADIRGFVFEPAAIRAKVGQEVTWTNHDPAPHTVTQEGGGFDSGRMAANRTFTHTFDQPGEYRYICALHPGMKGTVIVTG
jgi:plastocyanin